MLTEVVGGPLGGTEQEWEELHVCIPLPDGTYATYHKQPWDGCVFRYDGRYHFGQIARRDELEKVNGN